MLTTLPRLPSTATNEEIVDYVRHYYPNLGPLLNLLRERLEDRLDDNEQIKNLEGQIETNEAEISKLKDQLDEAEADRPKIGKCPHCGSEVTLELACKV
jgi:DNA repair exonuclease SbcCD ATPase subunit